MPKKVFRLGERRVISHFRIGKVSRRYLRLEEIDRNRGATKLLVGARIWGQIFIIERKKGWLRKLPQPIYLPLKK
jgi:hypothetical protein